MKVLFLLIFLIIFHRTFDFIIFGAIFGCIVYFWYKIRNAQQFWKRKNVKYVQPKFLFGFLDITRQKSITTQKIDLYQHHPEERYVGIYEFLEPILLIRDPDLIREITVSKFDYFMDHRVFADSDSDPYVSKVLTLIGGDKWRNMRATLSPCFTSSKMKMMYGLVEEIAQQFVQYLKNQKTFIVEEEVKDLLNRYANDVIATTCFGLKCNSLENKNDEFYQMGKEMLTVDNARFFQFIVISASMKLSKFLRFSIMPKQIGEYFARIIKETMRVREEKNIVRPDMIHLLMEAKKNRNNNEANTNINPNRSTNTVPSKITNDDIVSQAVLFFVAGFENISLQTQFLFYELAKNPYIQRRLRHEMQSISPSYENLLGLKYLDMVISETLRKWPVGFGTDRIVTKKVTIEPVKPSESVLTLEEGQIIWIISFGIHRDPKYYPDPEIFDPERFNEENRHRIKPGTYLPFGAGPRACIGSRFALMEIKLLIYYVLKHFEIVETEKTPEKLVFGRKTFHMDIEGGLWLGFKQL